MAKVRVALLGLALVATGTAPAPAQEFSYQDESFRLPADPEERLTDSGDVDLVDVDGDGDLDLFIAEGTGTIDGRQNRLLINDGNGLFADESAARLPQIQNNSIDVCFGDVDGDGDLDASVANVGPNQLLLNNGLGFFTDASEQLPEPPDDPLFDVSLEAKLLDIDGDMDLDIVVANEIPFPSPGAFAFLHVNDGDGFFTEETDSRLPSQRIDTRGLAFGDVDDDGDGDLVLANGGQDWIYINDGDGFFTDETGVRMPEVDTTSRHAELADLDDDGDLDIVIANSQQQPNALYVNVGGGFFIEASDRLPPAAGTTIDVDALDVDGDGDLDLYFANSGLRSMPPAPPPHTFDGELNRYLINDGTGVFEDVTLSHFPPLVDPSFDAEFGDVDGDGDLDVVVGNVETNGEEVLYIRRPGARPTATVAEPLDRTVHFVDTQIDFAGTASDPEDGDLSADLVWSSDLDGELGQGAAISVDSLSLGQHVITASATDGDGLVGSASIVLTVVNEIGDTFPILVDAFDGGAGDMVYVDDPFRDTDEPDYADGAWSANDGREGAALTVALGGIDDDIIDGMSGGWRGTFELPADARVTITFSYRLELASEYEDDEFSDLIVAVDGVALALDGETQLAHLVGDGNGGDPESTGWRRISVPTGALVGGEHTFTIGAYNNRKTFDDESTELSIDDVVVSGSGVSTLLHATFDDGAEGLGYVDDPFRDTDEPEYADGEFATDAGFEGGGLRIEVGGVDNDDVTGMSGGWSGSFELAEATAVQVSFRYRLDQDDDYDDDEESEVLFAIDDAELMSAGGTPIARVVGGGDLFGWRRADLELGPLSAGTHTFTLGAYNTLKTSEDELTELLIDDLHVSGNPLVALVDATFDLDADGLVYEDDPFRDTDEPEYASGQFDSDGGLDGGGVEVTLGGIDDDDVTEMSGGWRLDFNAPGPTALTLAFRYRLTQAPGYEDDEESELLVILDDTDETLASERSLARLVGDGQDDDDGEISTGWRHARLELGVVGAGPHSVVVGAFNNKKTLEDESTTLLLDDIVLGGAPTTAVLVTSFAGGPDGFEFVDDPFRDTDEPDYAGGEFAPNGGFAGGGLTVVLGGEDDDDIFGISGGWQRSFDLVAPTDVVVYFRYDLEMDTSYEDDEESEVLVSIDGVPQSDDFIARIDGDNNPPATGWREIVLSPGVLEAGTHVLTIGAFNNQKTESAEVTTLTIDNVRVGELP